MAAAARTRTRRERRPPVEAAPAERDYRGIAEAWEEGILSGQIDHGPLVIAAVKRQRAELERPPAGYVFDPDEAAKACATAELLSYPKGPKRGKPFVLEPWQVWLFWVLFGWIDAVSRLPRWHLVDLWISKGNGKSPMAAAIGLVVLGRGRRVGAKVYSAAVAEKQAKNVFEPAQEMVRLSPQFKEAAGLEVEEHRIRGIGDARVFETVSAEKRSADGTVGDCYIVDEVHQHPNRNLYDVLANNASKIDGSRLVIISTAGTDQSPKSIGWLLYCRARAVLGLPVEQVTAPGEEPPEKLDDGHETPGAAHFVLIFEADRNRDPWAESTWRQANPNYGVSVSVRNFRTTAEEARADPSAQPHFLSTRLGWWSRAANKWMDMNLWDAGAAQVDGRDFVGRKVFIGVDYAPELDLTAIVEIAASMRADGERQYVVRSHGYLPEQSPTLDDIPELRQWSPAWLTLTPGKVLAASYLRPILVAKVRLHTGSEVDLDPFGCLELMASLPTEQPPIEPVKIEQTWKHHSPAMKGVRVALTQGRLKHDGSPLMRLCMSNVVARTDRNGNVVPDRDHDGQKIDLAVALLNGMYRAMIADLMLPQPAGDGLSFVDLDEEDSP
jgi:phage terminase large subunit-like protein